MKRRAQQKSYVAVVDVTKPVPDVASAELGLNVSEFCNEGLFKRLRSDNDRSNELIKSESTPVTGLKRSGSEEVPFAFWKRFRTDPSSSTSHTLPIYNKMATDCQTHDLCHSRVNAMSPRIPSSGCSIRQDPVHKFEDTTVATHLDTPYGCFNFWKAPMADLLVDELISSKVVAMEVAP